MLNEKISPGPSDSCIEKAINAQMRLLDGAVLWLEFLLCLISHQALITLYLVNLDTAGMYMNRITETVLTSSVSWSVFVFPFNKKKTL